MSPEMSTAKPALSPVTPADPKPVRVPGRSRLAVVGITVVAALAWWAILAHVAGITLDARQGSLMHIGAGQVVFASAALAFLGWGLLAILERRTPNARTAWTVVATIVCLTSLGSPLSGGIGIGAKLGLASLHLVVGAIVVLGLRRTALSAAERC
ncbi:DUF6069 family protein [Kribbella sp. NPDC055071]